MAFTYLKVKSTKCLCLLPVVLVLVLLCSSWSWSCKQRSWSWSCYFGLGLGFGLKNLVSFTSLTWSMILHTHAKAAMGNKWIFNCCLSTLLWKFHAELYPKISIFQITKQHGIGGGGVGETLSGDVASGRWRVNAAVSITWRNIWEDTTMEAYIDQLNRSPIYRVRCVLCLDKSMWGGDDMSANCTAGPIMALVSRGVDRGVGGPDL